MIGSRRSSWLALLFAFTTGIGGCTAKEGEEDGTTADELTSPSPAPHVEYTEVEKDFVRTPQLPKTTLRVATAPMQCPLGCSQRDIQTFVEQLKQFGDLDVVVVTEAFFRKTRTWLTQSMKDAGYPVAIAGKREKFVPGSVRDALGLFEDTTYMEADMSSGVMIFARKQTNDDWLPESARTEMEFPESQACGEDKYAPKGALRTRFSLGKAPGGTPVVLNVVGAHFQANPELPMLCKYRTSQRQQIDRLDEWTEWNLERNQDGPSILSGDFNFESTGGAYADDGEKDSEVTEGRDNWNRLASNILRPAGLLPSFRVAAPTWLGKSAVAFSSLGSATVVRTADGDYGTAHRSALDDVRARANATQDDVDGKTGMDDKPDEVIKQFYAARSVLRNAQGPSGLVAELVPIRYERTAQIRFCRMESDGKIQIGRFHDPHDGYGARLVVAIDPDANCTSSRELVTLADFPHPGTANAADKQKHLLFDHATRVATYRLVVRRARDSAAVYPAPAAFLHYTAKAFTKADKRVSLSFELTPPPDQADAFDKALIRARVYEPAEGPWLAVKRTGKYTFVAEGVVPTAACGHYKVNVQVGYDVAAQRGAQTVATGFDQQVIVEQGLATGSPDWKATCVTAKDRDLARAATTASPVLSTR